MTESRTQKMFKSARISLCFYVLDILMHFVSRKVFIDKLGAEVLGLNTMAVNLLNLLNITELGVGVAVMTTLFKPLHDGDRTAINDILSIQGWFYRYAALVLVGISAVAVFFFPWIFAKADVPVWYPYATFSVLLFGVVSGYLWTYRQTVLLADQRHYAVIAITHGCRLFKVGLQIAAVCWLVHGYVWWLGLEVLGTGLLIWVTARVVHHYYPWLRPDWRNGGKIRSLYPEVFRKTKQVFIHRLGRVAVSQLTPVLVYMVASLSLVAIYGNYVLLFSGLLSLEGMVFGALVSGFGNLVASGKHDHARLVFWEVAALRYCLAFLFSILIWRLAPAFVGLWMGEAYVLETTPFLLLVVYYFCRFSQISHHLLYSYGVLHDVGAPIADAVLTIGGGWLLGRMWGLSGVLAGMIVGQVVITVCWKGWFICRHGLRIPVWVYVRKTLGFLLLGGMGVGLLLALARVLPLPVWQGWLGWLFHVVLWGGAATLLLAVFFTVGSADFRRFYRRVPVLKKWVAGKSVRG